MGDYNIVKNSKNPKVIAMLSGGKDSIATIVLLKKSGLDVTAIHFVHEWGTAIPTEEAKRICNIYKVPLIINDYTHELCDAINGYKAGRPCLLCKKQMYKILLKYLNTGDYGWLCIGDNSNDRTTITRIKQFINEGHPKEDLMCSSYFGSEIGLYLPVGMKVIRPLIDMSTKDVDNFLKNEGINTKRINSTGDKYFEYHREGCPIQFADIGVELNVRLYADLKKYNDCITKFAREKGILASIHMPSTFIITIPRGYEKMAAEYLETEGLIIDNEVNASNVPQKDMLIGHIYNLQKSLEDSKTYEKVFYRFLERLELYGDSTSVHSFDSMVFCTYRNSESSLDMLFDFCNGEADIKYLFSEKAGGRKDKSFFENLIIEMFRTRKYRVFDSMHEVNI